MAKPKSNGIATQGHAKSNHSSCQHRVRLTVKMAKVSGMDAAAMELPRKPPDWHRCPSCERSCEPSAADLGACKHSMNLMNAQQAVCTKGTRVLHTHEELTGSMCPAGSTSGWGCLHSNVVALLLSAHVNCKALRKS